MLKLKKENLYILGFLIFLAVISLLIIKSFIVPLIFTAILVYLFHPIHNKLLKIFKNDLITSIISSIIILTLIIIPATLTIWEISNEIKVLENPDIKKSLNQISSDIKNNYNINLNLTKEYYEFVEDTKTQTRSIIYNKIPEFIFNIFVIIFFFYYFLKNYERESSYFKVLLDKLRINDFKFKIKKLIDGIFYGQILTRLIQAMVGTALLFLIGIKGALILGVLMFFSAFLPIIGTSLVWGPILIYNLLTQNYLIALFVLLAGLIISAVDNFLLPYLISNKINIGPVITLMSILGGLQLFGIYGVFLGPFFVGVFFVFFEEFIIRFRKDNPSIKRYMWTKEERQKYKKLKTKIAKEEYIRILERKYKIEEAKGENIKYRYVIEK